MSIDHDPLYNEDNPRLTADGWRELTAEEYIRTHMPHRYRAIAELVDLTMEVNYRIARRGCQDCDETYCERHSYGTRVAERFVRLRDRAWLRAKFHAEQLFRSAPWSTEETAARLELDRFRASFADSAYSQVTEDAGMRWQRAFRIGNQAEDRAS